MRRLLILATLLLLGVSVRAGDHEVRQAMRRATQYMMDEVSVDGGFVWNYLPDFSRQWGELEARRSMVWLQSPGTPDVGQVLLDAYHATGDEYYYNCARRVAMCIIGGQMSCGGWNYMFDLAGEDSIREWYATIGKQAWRLEEFQHYYGNATFDDEATKHCSEFLLRIYLEKRDEALLAPLRRAIDFFVRSQYANGGWPQRFPLMYDHPFRGKADYSSFITLNDNVMVENIDFLLQCYTQLGMAELREPILRAMHLMRDLQQPEPLAGWADQYEPASLQPAHARSYEPRSVNTGTTVGMFFQMIQYYRLTGDASFLEGLPAAIDFLESQRLPSSLAAKVRRTQLQEDEILMPRFIDPDTRRPLYVHRKGSNVANGAYYMDENTDGTIAHYSSFATVSLSRMRQALKEAKSWVQKDLERNSPLRMSDLSDLSDLSAPSDKPKTYYYRGMGRLRPGMQLPSADEVVAALDDKGRWLVPLRQMSNPFKPLPKGMETESDITTYTQTMVGDEYDTSPFENREVRGISTQAYIQNMTLLIRSLMSPARPTASGLNPERFASVVEGKPTQLYTLTNNGMEACITNYGARLVSLMVPDKDGIAGDVVLGFDNIEDYHLQKNNFGSVVGRYVGRIKGARFSLDGKTYDLQGAGKGNISHGGYPGFADHVWDVEAVSDTTLRLLYVSPDGENGFPGKLTTHVTYRLTHSHALEVEYEAVTDKPTVVNLTNHTFFNLAGDTVPSVLGHQLYVDSKYIATYDKQKNVDGKMMRVRNTPFDFTTMKTIGSDIEIYDEQMSITKGYDHAFVLRHPGITTRPAVVLRDEKSGRQLSVFTDQPAVQVYTANGLNGSVVGKRGVAYQRQCAVCLETMHFADSPNHREFPSTVLRPDEKYHSKTVFQFGLVPHKKRDLTSSILLYGGAASLTGLGVFGVVSLIK